MTGPGRIVVLNGAPRSGKTSVCVALQERAPGVWINLGVDWSRRSLPERYQPGIGLRPGGERPDLEDLVVTLYEALYESVAAHARLGLDVVVDVGHHDDYSQHRNILGRCAHVVEGLPVLFVGVHCPLDEIWRRREATWGQSRESADVELVRAAERWQNAVHAGVTYDMEVDTSLLSPQRCAELVTERLELGPAGEAFREDGGEMTGGKSGQRVRHVPKHRWGSRALNPRRAPGTGFLAWCRSWPRGGPSVGPSAAGLGSGTWTTRRNVLAGCRSCSPPVSPTPQTSTARCWSG